MYEQYATFADSLTLVAFDRTIAAGINASLSYMRPALMVLVVIAGASLMLWNLSLWWVGRRVLTALFVISVLQVGAYNSYIRDPFWTTIPNLIATSVSGSPVAITTAQRFDRVDQASAHVTALAKARLSFPWHMGESFSITISRAGASILLGLCFVVWLVARIAIAMLIAAGPFLLIAAIFDATRPWVMQWLGKLVSLSVWTLMSTILTEMVLAGSMAWTQRVAAQAGVGLEQAVDGLLQLLAWYAISACVMLGLPFYSAIGSSASAGTSIGMGMSMATGRIGASAAMGAARGAANAVRRLNRKT